MSVSTAPGRIACPRCAANNFDTQAACWKCGTSLMSGAGLQGGNGMAAPIPVSAAAPPIPGAGGTRPLYAEYSAPSAVGRPDPLVATIAAALLGIFFPYIGVPAGLMFMMFDDRRRIQVGRIALVWGVIGTIGQTLFFGILLKGTYDTAMSLFKGISGASQRVNNLGDNVPKLSFPGFPGANAPDTPFPKVNE